ncbi:MAG: hypothetical protein ABII39_03640 [Candidatus Micrarchaeota archaeon]
MTSFTVTGRYELRHFMEFCFMQEFQFEITDKEWEEKISVTFYKGSWSLFFSKDKERLVFSDNGEVTECTNSLYHGMVEGLTTYQKDDIGYIDPRRAPAKALARFLAYFILEAQNIDRDGAHFNIHILQEGRNGTMDENGEIALHPRQQEFRFEY